MIFRYSRVLTQGRDAGGGGGGQGGHQLTYSSDQGGQIIPAILLTTGPPIFLDIAASLPCT